MPNEYFYIGGILFYFLFCVFVCIYIYEYLQVFHFPLLKKFYYILGWGSILEFY